MHPLSDRITRISGASSRGQLSFERKLGYSPLVTSSYKGHNRSDNAFTEQNASYFLLRILAILKREGYLRFYRIRTVGRCVSVTVFLKYTAQGVPAIRSIFPVSTPGRPVYVTTSSLWQPLSTTGTFILSTSRGLITDREARRLAIGGHLILGVIL